MEESVFDFWFFPRKRIHLSRPQRPATGFQTVSEVLGASATQLHILSPQAAYLRSVVQRLVGNWGQELGLIYGTEDGWRGSKSVEQIDNIYSVLGFREFRGTDVLGTYHSKEKKNHPRLQFLTYRTYIYPLKLKGCIQNVVNVSGLLLCLLS